jgi:hypothetical protein
MREAEPETGHARGAPTVRGHALELMLANGTITTAMHDAGAFPD